MTFDFERYLTEKLGNIVSELNFTDENGNPETVNVIVTEEQLFAKMEKLTPNNIYVVIKYLSSNIEYYTETLPLQLLVLSEQNSFKKAEMIMNKFATDNNWQIIIDDGTHIKQQYNSPVVLNNFVEVDYGYRSVLYVTGTLFIMENVVDVTDVEIDDEKLKPLSFNLAYSMSTNTQQTANEEIASSLKTVSTFAITMTIPMRELKTHPGLITNVMKIINETETGNKAFKVSFKCGLYDRNQESQTYGQTEPIIKYMRLISAQIITAPNQVPSLQLGFMK